MKNDRGIRVAASLFVCLIAGGASLAALADQPSAAAGVDDHRSVPLQPLAQHVRRLESALTMLGQPLAAEDQERINRAVGMPDEAQAVHAIEQALAPYVLIEVTINPESRVSLTRGAAASELIEGGTRVFLLKVNNQAGITAPLRVSSPNSGKVYISSFAGNGAAEPPMVLGPREVAERWADITLFSKPPMAERLSGLALEYAIAEIYSRDRGQRAAEISLDVGQGTADIGHRNSVSILFTAAPARTVWFSVRDERNRPSIAAFTIRDRQGRLYPRGSKRLAPDLPFQPQIYRGDGEDVELPDGRYEATYSAGPEYIPGRLTLDVSDAKEPRIAVRLQRWIDPSARGWYSGDHHVHAAGCSHYQNPTEGVGPEDMIRQVRGEALNVGAVLTWGPCYYHQKQFFSGSDHPLSTEDRLLHYDLEVSGFPSSHAGHLVLLGLEDQDYPGTKRIEDWPSWDLPVLQWARKQGAVTGFAHSGWGLETKATEVPNDEMPAFDGIGANEYIVDVTYPGSVDFISAVDTPYPWELNIWYHTLNVGFRTRLSGETDFPCITDERVGAGRTYAKLDRLTYRGWLDAIRSGRTYVSDGFTHLMDFAVNGTAAGTDDSEITLDAAGSVHVTVDVAGLLDPVPDRTIGERPPDQRPYWSIERARIGSSRKIPVEVVVNGLPVASREVLADGTVRPLAFDVPVARSSWIAVRVLGAAHTNPVFVIVGGQPIRASRQSAEWCLAAVDQAWSQKAGNIRREEREAAARAYEHARETYRKLIAESQAP